MKGRFRKFAFQLAFFIRNLNRLHCQPHLEAQSRKKKTRLDILQVRVLSPAQAKSNKRLKLKYFIYHEQKALLLISMQIPRFIQNCVLPSNTCSQFTTLRLCAQSLVNYVRFLVNCSRELVLVNYLRNWVNCSRELVLVNCECNLVNCARELVNCSQ